MKKSRFNAAFLGGLSFLITQQITVADTNTTQVSSAGNQSSIYDKISEKGSLSYFGIYRGGPLNNPGSPVNPTMDGTPDSTSPQGVESLVTLGYKFNQDTLVGAVTHFSYFPFLSPQGSDARLQMLDPFLTISKSNLINNDGLKLRGMLNLFLPFSKNDILLQQHLATAISPTFVLSYDVPNTRLSTGIFSYLRGYIPNPDSAFNARSYKIYAAPNANYQLSSTVALTLWVDLLQLSRNQNTGFVSGIQNDPVDIEPGINWDINKNISINPIINIYPGHPTLAATSFQAFISARAF